VAPSAAPSAPQPTIASSAPAVVAELVYSDGTLAGKRIPVTAEIVLGRENADLVLDDDLVSRRHAAVRPVPGGVEITDLGSSNGTYVNRARIDGPQLLQHGDTVHIGRVSFQIELTPQP